MSFEYKNSEKVLRELVDIDGHLTLQDRKELASAIGRAEMNALTFDWGGTVAAFSGFIYLYKYKPQKYLGTPGKKIATYGTLILGGMLISAGSHVYFASNLVKQFEGKEYPYKAAQLVATSNLALWWAYYKMTAEEPQNSLSNPKMLQNMEERLNLKKGTLTSLPPTQNQMALPKTEQDKQNDESKDERPWNKLASDSFGNSKDDIWGEEPEKVEESDTPLTKSWDDIRKDAGVKQGTWNRPAAAPTPNKDAGIPQIPISERPNASSDSDGQGLGLAQAEFDRQLDLERQGYKSTDDFSESEKKWK
ncbi:hypothetical protein B0I72DRAFT_12629 [Yarrowia lipolytica]|jgi:hypothetical protein|uniref:YALI0F11099p n=2 Tax=Yarrowia lipolytica TaxID=4952 RepID=Q6C240_YARLI|nr:YALI0F11099p [Yarrowia lipolytica CLIB122]AOW06976.1 hypothetical protein YALI1_F14746g [Yarrowia lipolytica]KAB8282246.1 hypothetical protein BKA91DRAFT_25560 [Yarrowia lipolytica]KAE8172866.1 hypothetical protein BKA90DRAFT_15529 [Yarrowia lipolytica]KAJ8055852.1 hypothetical protein LXG23DRAFT_35488 [Yarrowia lipolytica]QNQ00672.1 Hypothetical protein YALI2_F00217g [Yarrowia lipolytica]|eukprot:XP_505272.1 YALI0F11099p [Yarrowia lipolytica CLIB122]